MFDVGFSELIVIALVALIVIGPERLPRVARTLGALLGRAQRYVNDVKADIQREVDLDELKNLQSTFQDAAKSVEQSVNQVGEELHAAGESMNQSIAGAADATPAPAPAPAAEVPAAEVPVPEAPAPVAETPASAPAIVETASASASAQMDLGLEAAPATAPAAIQKT
ncbi:MAG: Sec-independent protein translocase protein TatB [Proteobacteria bacterium]|nr:Sec-independent protein translocase protein TatB [Pseudomonadota bacterium]